MSSSDEQQHQHQPGNGNGNGREGGFSPFLRSIQQQSQHEDYDWMGVWTLSMIISISSTMIA
jgi:hypothetical protein